MSEFFLNKSHRGIIVDCFKRSLEILQDFETKINTLFSGYIKTRETSFIEQLNKLKTEE